MFSRLINYLKETRQELKKVNWPSKQDTMRFTILVIAISLAVSAFLGGLDAIFGFTLRQFLF